MAFNKDQNDLTLPTSNSQDRSASNFLPKYFRTDTNKKFIGSTIDQMMNQGVVEKVNAYAGRRYSQSTQPKDTFLKDISKDRENYQFEPVTLYKDNLNNVEFLKDYNDYISQIKNFKGSTDNHSLLNSQEFYSWDPHIDWDKFVNFREYYWLPNGPIPIPIIGQSKSVISTYTVTVVEDDDNFAYVFTPNSFTRNPSIKLYRGQTYRFEINAPGHPMAFAVLRTFVDTDPTTDVNFSNVSTLYTNGVTSETEYVENGIIEFTIPDNAPDILYYISRNDINASGVLRIFDISENSELDIELEILGKKTYTTSSGVNLSNGMKVFFQGKTTPEEYQTGFYYVEGVGSKINLIPETDLEIPSIFTTNFEIPFDDPNIGYDQYPFEDATSFPGVKDYITINRASADRNPWSRYNRWFHENVIIASAEATSSIINLDQLSRAKRPIIEFEPGIKLYNHGTKAKANVNLVDTYTKDVFSTIEGSIGYNVDGIDLIDGMRVLFTADTDILVKNKIYLVNFITHNGKRQISLLETDDTLPELNDTVLVTNGTEYKGKMFYFDGVEWFLSQDKNSVNQPPVFDLYTDVGVNYKDNTQFPASSFTGNKIFSYRVGTGIVDSELGFSLTYKNIANVGDIVFDFNLLSETVTFQDQFNVEQRIATDIGFLKKYNKDGVEFQYVNAWKKAKDISEQPVIISKNIDSQFNNFLIDVFDNSSTLSDLRIKVYVNGKLKTKNIDYTTDNSKLYSQVVFNSDLKNEDILVIKCFSKSSKNENGFYEIPINLEKNPANNNITEFTLGEVNDHVTSIIEDHPLFTGIYPGKSNLRDIGDLTEYGKRFVQHSGPINLSLYHITDKNSNIVKSLKFARKEYAKFKRNFLREASETGFHGSTKDHVDLVLSKIVKDKIENLPFFFSDMLGFGAFTKTVHDVEYNGPAYFALSTAFDLNSLSTRAVYVYRNNEQLVHGVDYIFVNGFVYVTLSLLNGDIVEIYEYESTNGSYIPPTPTKLGLYPKYMPTKYLDNTYSSPVNVIQGHDGSITIAFNDYRDDLLLELENRIYNNIKIEYNKNLIDIHDFVGGYNRNTSILQKNIFKAMLADFAQWLEISGTPDYTVHNFYNSANSFTYNYNNTTDINNNPVEGYWRNIYKQYYDTDRPHTHPWEMLGFYIKPSWWEQVYGPAPYTKDNLILWTDLQEGIIREPAKLLKRDKKYYRPDLLKFIPVNEYGQLLSPLESGLISNFSYSYSQGNFKFGDHAPVETAWRRSSEYPFALILAWVILQPAKIIGLGFDYSRIKRDITGNIIYSESKKRIRTKDIIFPSIKGDNSSILSSGFITYISNYMTSKISANYDAYKEYLPNLTNQLAVKLGGFADKSKLKLVLDSRSPLNKSSVFVPDENYEIILNKSSALDIVTLSGIIIEKTNFGYIISGYDKENPVFTYNKFIEKNYQPTITVGGISEPFVNWSENQLYPINTVVFYENKYYRTKITHTSEDRFDPLKFISLPFLPTEGGIVALIRDEFENEETELPYGSLLSSVQDVVDFMLGYENYLIKQGFILGYYNAETEALEDMKLCIQEFMFWVTQNWDDGTVISVSPVANKVLFNRQYFVVDDIYDDFYDYNLLSGAGSRLNKEFCNIFRNNANEFGVKLVNVDEGIFLVKLPLIQKEHVILIDNETVFNDTIYDINPGYRQERIKLVGYRTDNWVGSLDIPGFFYDNAKISNWNIWTDYALGDLVKYKEFYYSANQKHTSNEFFDANKWNILQNKPQAQLYSNWDYRVNQFTDFYSLETDNFDTEQQRLGQHLIGYQPREYLANIITDTVSQYKFYQGYIQEKGTKNSLTKLFDALSSADKDSLEFYEEWAIRLGQYGASDNIYEVEYEIDEAKFRLEPQLFELVNSISTTRTDLVYEITPFQTYLKPVDYTNNLFVEKQNFIEYTRNNGYVRNQDVDYISNGKDQILNLNIDDVLVGNYIWVQNNNNSWNVLRLHSYNNEVLTVEDTVDEPNENRLGFTLIFEKDVDIVAGDIVGIRTSLNDINGFFKVENAVLNRVSIVTDNAVNLNELNDSTPIAIIKFIERRFSDIENCNEKIKELKREKNDYIWLDNVNSGFAVYRNENIIKIQEEISNPLQDDEDGFATSFDSNDSNTVVVVGSPGSNLVRIYKRPADSFAKVFEQLLEQDNTIDLNSNFGFDVAISADYEYIAVGAPTASNAKTKFVGFIEPGKTFNTGDIVNDRGILWRAKVTVNDWQDLLGDSSTIQVSDQDWEPVYLLETDSAGTTDYGYNNQGVVYLYKKNTSNTYELVHCIVSPEPKENERFGYKVEIRKTVDNFYRLFIGAPGEDNIDNGRIYFLDNLNDVWSYSQNRNYKGIYGENYKYNLNDIVFYDGKLWLAKTNIPSGVNLPGIDVRWEQVNNLIEHTGYVPHQSVTIIEDNDINLYNNSYNIGKKFDINKNGSILIFASPFEQIIPVIKDRVSIFRNEQNRWKFSQTIDTTDSTEDFGYVISINDTGNKIAIGAPRNDDAGIDQGLVYLYNQRTINNAPIFELTQTIKSPFEEKNEAFGTGIDFSNNKLAISGKNTDAKIETTFDNFSDFLYTARVKEDSDGRPIYSKYVFDMESQKNEKITTFDGNTTKFIQRIKDVGRIAIFEQINDTWIYAEDLNYNRNIQSNDISNFKFIDNHLYIGLPKINPSKNNDSTLPIEYLYLEDSSNGLFVDLRHNRNENSWKVVTSQTGAVNVEKINKIFFYSKETNDILSRIDVIDPRQNKIAAVAEQYLDFKTFYDPAIYTINESNVTSGEIIQNIIVDENLNWTDNYVGKLWWNLSTASWYNPYQGDIQYRISTWNKLLPNASIDVCEWVQTNLLPSQWNAITDTNEGIAQGISGTTLYDDSVYSVKQIYDPISGSFNQQYFYWVKNKRLLPNNSNRKLSAYDIANLIRDPANYGYRFIAPLDLNKFAIFNSKSLIKDKDSILHFNFSKNTDLIANIHSEYQLITEGLASSKINKEIEQKWFDSLIGYDLNSNRVPDSSLSAKQKYGILNYPRQSMFVNRLEAVKQLVERANIVLKQNQIVDNVDFTRLLAKDEIPNSLLGKYDSIVDTNNDLRFVGVAKTEQAVLHPNIVNGKIVSINIENAGRGYKIAPELIVTDEYGKGALLKSVINNLGQITNVIVRSSGKNYSTFTNINVRKFSVLVSADNEIGGRWAIYSWDKNLKIWSRESNQAYDTSRYWNYVDWYLPGYNANTAIDQSIDQSYQLFSLQNKIGDIVKINNVGTGGWLLLEKINNELTEDYTLNYKTIGRKNGTIELSPRLYDYATTLSGFDASVFDLGFYDREPVEELRNILYALRDNIFISNLEVEYNKLFFASLRYVFAEQSNVDWAFKTSFVRAKHNLGNLVQKVNFQNDNLENYQDYVSEVKPYHTKVREYISSYATLDNTNSLITDFDLPPLFNFNTSKIQNSEVKIADNVITNLPQEYLNYPFKNWVDNNGYEIVRIDIIDGGSGYLNTPVVQILNNNNTTARAYVSRGSVSSIEIVNTGGKYYTAPEIQIDGNISENGSTARAVAILGNGKPKKVHVVLKFDRIKGEYTLSTLNVVENFVGTGAKEKFTLKWPIDIKLGTYEIFVDNVKQLQSQVIVGNETDNSKGYTREVGFINFTNAPALNSVITINYRKDVKLLDAADRINFYYNPTSGMPGKNLSQLMDGVNYTGVKIDSIRFGNEQGFDVGGFGSLPWDTFNNIFEDEIFILDDSTLSLELSKPLEAGIAYNFYKNGIRLDDPNFADSSGAITNPNAVIETIIGDGITTTILIDNDIISTTAGDIIVIRKTTSDGSIIPVSSTYDTSLIGGNLEYTTATGIASEDIIIDGDNFVTPTTSKGPEELIPGQIMDTLDIQVYNRVTDGIGVIGIANYKIDGSQNIFALPSLPQSNDAVIVKLDNQFISPNLYSVDYINQTIEFNDSTLSINSLLSITTIGVNGSQLLDSSSLIFDGSSTSIVTKITYNNEMSAFITSNGVVLQEQTDYLLLNSTDNDGIKNKLKIVFYNGVLSEGDLVTYTIYSTRLKTFSQVIIDNTFEPDGINNYHIFDTNTYPIPFNKQPLSHNVLVKVNNSILNPGYRISYTTTNERTYDIESWQFNDTTSISESEILVFADGVQLDKTEFTYDPINARITILRNDIAVAGSYLEIHVIKDAEYYFIDTEINFASIDSTVLNVSEFVSVGNEINLQSGSTTYSALVKSVDNNRVIIQKYRTDLRDAFVLDNEFTLSILNGDSTQVLISDIKFILSDSLTFKVAPSSGTNVEIYTFSNHDVNNFKRYVYKIRMPIFNADSSVFVPENTVDYTKRNLQLSGYFQIEGSVSSANYVWVAKNGELLTPNVDYILVSTLDAIQLTNLPANNDIIDIIQFANTPVINKFGYRIFKDILNRTHYKRLNENNSYILAQPLNYYDTRIVLENANGIFVPNKQRNIPGVIFVNGERIEYFEISNNRLLQLRRGTLGTGVKTMHEVGSKVYGQGPNENINYSDTVYIQTYISDGSSTLSLDFTPSSVNEIEVFVAGRKLRKFAIHRFNNLINQDSPEADQTISAEFSIDSNIVTFSLDRSNSTPIDGEKIQIVRNLGKLWTGAGESLALSNSSVAQFLRNATIQLPK